MKAHIVVGCGYGDEGKGITTDFLCSKLKHPIVVRYSGGPQAAHTVVHKKIQHIHSNFGSGTLRGIPSYFSQHTCIYPVTIARETAVLKERGIDKPQLFIHPLAKVITPFDVFASRKDRKNLEDGTCGLGIGKTMRRNLGLHKLFAIDLLHLETLKLKLKEIAKGYGVNAVNSDGVREEMAEFLEAVKKINWEIRSPKSLLQCYSNIIFEGSQGILLDMDHGVYPHVTYANTTSKNAHEICNEVGIEARRMYYVTRSYHTRHGNGPFHYGTLKLNNRKSETNIYNEYQGMFRTAPIDYDLLNHAIDIDRIYSGGLKYKTLVVTCLDQQPNFDYDRVNGHFINRIEICSPRTEDIKSKLIA